jgi:glycosyltransferase involved in cell wall biosynthesis
VKFVFLVTRSDPIGGAQIFIRDHCEALVARGHDVTVLTGAPGTFTGQLTERGIRWGIIPHLSRSLSSGRDARALVEIRCVLKAIGPDLVCAHCAKAGSLGRLAAWSLRLPVVYTPHYWSFTEGVPRRNARLYRWGERFLAPFAARIITVSEFDRQLAIRQRVAPRRKLVTITNGMPDIPASDRAQPGRSPVLLTMVARFEPQKDHASLLRALANLKQHAWRLDLIGDGPLLGRAQELTGELGISDRVRYLGQRNDVTQRLAESQIYALTSNWEGFPLSILEAMRAGLPVIASHVGGVGEAVKNGITGFLVPRADTEALVLRLGQLLSSPELRSRLGTTGRARYEERYTFERSFRRTLAVYQEVLRDQPGTGRRGIQVPERLLQNSAK